MEPTKGLVVPTAVVSEVKYNYDYLRIYDLQTIIIASDVVENPNDDPLDAEIVLEYEDITGSSWTATDGVQPGELTRLVAGIPLNHGDDFEGLYIWASVKKFENKIKSETYTVHVPPKSKVTVILEATKASFGVPFSYLVSDSKRINHFATYDNGSYTSDKLFDLKFKTVETQYSV